MDVYMHGCMYAWYVSFMMLRDALQCFINTTLQCFEFLNMFFYDALYFLHLSISLQCLG